MQKQMPVMESVDLPMEKRMEVNLNALHLHDHSQRCDKPKELLTCAMFTSHVCVI